MSIPRFSILVIGLLAVLLVVATPGAALTQSPVADETYTDTVFSHQDDPFRQYSGSKECQKDCYHMCAVSCNDGWCMIVCMNSCDDYCRH